MRRLAPTLSRLSSPESGDEEKTSPRRTPSTTKTTKTVTKRTKKAQPKSPCVRNLMKDVNDNNKNKPKETMSEFNIKVTNAAESPKSAKSSRTNNIADKNTKAETLDKKEVKSKIIKEKSNSTKLITLLQKRHNKHKDKVDKSSNNDVKIEDAVKAKQAKIVLKTKTPDTKPVQTKMENKSWTRDEDKTMLQILQGEAGSEEIFCRIRELLPHRSITEIKDRFFHVMNLLQQMALSEVT